MKQKRFRSDLYFRISTLQLVVPPLRDRIEDIPLLAEGMLSQFAARRGRGGMTLTEDAHTALRDYPWPGNLRELRNVIERAVLLSGTSALTRKDLRFDTQVGGDEAEVSDLTLKELERRHIERVLRDEQGNVERAAGRLGVPKSSLYEKLKRYGIRMSRS
jgi:DNA-binding NtrC family response regulator